MIWSNRSGRLGRQELRQLPATVNKLANCEVNATQTLSKPSSLPLAALATQFVDPFAQDGHKQINFSYLIYQELNQVGRTPPQTGQCAGREALTQLVFTSSTTSPHESLEYGMSGNSTPYSW